MTGSTQRARRTPVQKAPIAGFTILALGRDGTSDALRQLRQYSTEQLSRGLQELSPAERVEFLETAERVDEIVPLLPETEFTRTVRGYGIEESGWLVEFASPEQRIAAVDLDCWRDARFSPSRFFDWIDAMIEAGPETLAASFFEIDDEIWTLAMRAMGDFEIVGFAGSDDIADSFGAGMTIDGVVYYDAHSADHESRIREVLTTAFEFAPAKYWSLVYSAISAADPESNEYAVRWQRNRLGDLGFPERAQAMQVYRPLTTRTVPVVDSADAGDSVAIVTCAGRSPARADKILLGQTLAELPADRGNEVMSSILAVANSLAVADRLGLMDDATAERSLAKAVRGIERGLEEIARAQNRSLVEVLDAIPPLDLFRVGATLDSSLRPRTPRDDWTEPEEGDDWDVETEMVEGENEKPANLNVRPGTRDTN